MNITPNYKICKVEFDGYEFDPNSSEDDIWYNVINPIIDEHIYLPNWYDDVDAIINCFLDEYRKYPNVIKVCEKFFHNYGN